ncbi:MAG: flagellar basal body P-ring protein FlgI [Selenomonadaceae bacterium]|nr:flagellar basal body P-ring protein FlgI [Selenomonadaceae bacterium]
MKKLFTILTLILCIAFTSTTVFAESAPTRIKDIAKVQGVRNNQLVGYGLVVGLQGTGDSDKITPMISSTASMLRTFGVAVDTDEAIKYKNIAVVMVTATLPPFVREGDNIDIIVSSMGDAKSIQGGTLLQTPLRAGNGEVYAVAQGPVSTGGFIAGNGSGNTAQKNFPTVGTTPNGAIVERTVEDEIGQQGQISLSLAIADFTTATRVAGAINSAYGSIAHAANPARIDIHIPNYYRSNVVEFVSTIEELSIIPDSVAKVVFNERTGTIVMGGNVTVDECAITQGGLSIRVTRETDISQPAPFSYGRTMRTVTNETDVEEQPSSSIVMPPTTNINDIVGALNAVGATPRDCISILQAMKAAGAIHAVLEII